MMVSDRKFSKYHENIPGGVGAYEDQTDGRPPPTIGQRENAVSGQRVVQRWTSSTTETDK